MVTPNQPRDRAQVILIGAIVIAFVILGVVVVFNGLLYTEEVSSSETIQSVGHTETTHDEVISTIQGIIADEYNKDYQVSNEDQLEENLSAYVNTFNDLHTNSSPSSVHINDIHVETNEDDLARANDDVLGPSAGPSTGNNIWIEQDENVAEEIYEFTYNVEGDDEIRLEFVGIGKDISVDQSSGETEIVYDGTSSCYYPHQNVTIDFLHGGINGEAKDCNPGIIGVAENSNHNNIDRVALIGDHAKHDVGEYNIIAESVKSGNAAWIKDVPGPVSFAEVTFIYESTDVRTNRTTRVTGFGELP